MHKSASEDENSEWIEFVRLAKLIQTFFESLEDIIVEAISIRNDPYRCKFWIKWIKASNHSNWIMPIIGFLNIQRHNNCRFIPERDISHFPRIQSKNRKDYSHMSDSYNICFISFKFFIIFKQVQETFFINLYLFELPEILQFLLGELWRYN